MKFLWFNVETKKELRAKISEFERKYEDANHAAETYVTELTAMHKLYPLTIGALMYDVQLRGENGRYTRTKASREHSLINEVVVTETNYFKLKKRMLKNDVFFSRIEAENYLDNVCIR